MGITFFFICIILVASILQASTGFGFSIMATPFLLMLFLPQEAIQINITLSLIISISLIWKIRMDVDFVLLKRFIFGSIVGVPFGILIFISVNINTFKLAVSILLLLLTLLLICNVKVRSTQSRDLIVGGLSGLLTTSIGMPGPPLLLYFTGTNTEKEKLRATTLAFYLFIYFISLVTQILFTGTNKTIWESSFYAIPIVFLGLFIGQIIFKWLNQRIFKIFTYILLSCTGGYLLIESLNLL
ncbi:MULTISPECIES: sulfite exporter TauE/SafE family protein [Bacillus]|uniref:Probable membrane transporter protein n=1 Tax=Bacillus thuringiensis TaxID=1428 RepID=A0A9X5WHU7_BACTU|nr:MULTISPECIES: sulfite exporter TauE/SafE family protein [Bacillus]EKS7843862.1 sulfite exporter TauE/SafE family protein [Bacillus cereus]MCU4978108.1 sulfite exporter TauE/SafE family protein [Bacillus cereus]MCU5035693.1 sulfite exporter TauE/SafE family protein [Bacillus cereus]MCU5318674.1 sulfite exporter TauE/SafE family protein [Bacillus cereus]MCU5571290.1 sulfite exporter TauE/SafE family protein [Bacillus cereus]